MKDGKTDCGWAKARFEGPGAQLVKLTRDGSEDSKEKDGVSCGDLPGGYRNHSSLGIYHFDTSSLPDEFDILQIGSGAGLLRGFIIVREEPADRINTNLRPSVGLTRMQEKRHLP